MGLTPCREWRGATRNGYGRRWVKSRGKVESIHRWVVAEIHGWDAIEGKDVLHLCDNPPCYRYDHLVIGTRAENNADREAKGRGAQPKGEAHGSSKLTTDQVRYIRANPPPHRGLRPMAREYGITHKALSNILNRKSWTHVD